MRRAVGQDLVAGGAAAAGARHVLRVPREPAPVPAGRRAGARLLRAAGDLGRGPDDPLPGRARRHGAPDGRVPVDRRVGRAQVRVPTPRGALLPAVTAPRRWRRRAVRVRVPPADRRPGRHRQSAAVPRPGRRRPGPAGRGRRPRARVRRGHALQAGRPAAAARVPRVRVRDGKRRPADGGQPVRRPGRGHAVHGGGGTGGADGTRGRRADRRTVRVAAAAAAAAAAALAAALHPTAQRVHQHEQHGRVERRRRGRGPRAARAATAPSAAAQQKVRVLRRVVHGRRRRRAGRGRRRRRRVRRRQDVPHDGQTAAVTAARRVQQRLDGGGRHRLDRVWLVQGSRDAYVRGKPTRWRHTDQSRHSQEPEFLAL